MGNLKDWLQQALSVGESECGMAEWELKTFTQEYYDKARHFEQILAQIADGAKLQYDGSWKVTFTGEYINQLRELLGMGQVGKTEDSNSVPLSMWPEAKNESDK